MWIFFFCSVLLRVGTRNKLSCRRKVLNENHNLGRSWRRTVNKFSSKLAQKFSFCKKPFRNSHWEHISWCGPLKSTWLLKNNPLTALATVTVCTWLIFWGLINYAALVSRLVRGFAEVSDRAASGDSGPVNDIDSMLKGSQENTLYR